MSMSMSKPRDDASGPGLVILGAAASIAQTHFELIYQLTAWAIMILGGFISSVTFYWKWQDRKSEAAARLEQAGRRLRPPMIRQPEPPEAL